MTYMIGTLETGAHVRGILRGDDAYWQAARMSESYFRTDPEELAEKLRRSGCFGAVTVQNLGRKRTKGWRHVVVAREPEYTGTARPEYIGSVSMLLDHTGRKADLLRQGAIRIACENQFLGGCIKFHHCSEEIRKFWTDPVPYCRAAIATGSRQVMSDLESLRGIGDGRELVEMVKRAAPRVGRQLVNACCASPGNRDFYNVLQGCTLTRRPKLALAATQILTVGLAEAQRGEVPQCWRALFPERN